MNKTAKIVLLLLIIISLCLLCVKTVLNNFASINGEKICGVNKNSVECYDYLYKKLVPYYLIYEAKSDKKPLKFIRLGISRSSNYVVPTVALEKSEAVFGYGILHDILFEDRYSQIYDKPSWGFDCGIENIATQSPKCIFESECIGTDKFVLSDLNSSQKLHSYSQKIKDLKLEKKPVFIRMDIAGGEPYVIDDILKNSTYITGISIVIHADSVDQIDILAEMLPKFEKDFIPVARETHWLNSDRMGDDLHIPGTKGLSTKTCLTYINKNLTDSYRVKYSQNTKNMSWEGDNNYRVYSDISLIKYFPVFVYKQYNAIKDSFKDKKK